ncbi:hypothetical protein D3C84_714220 [compost metagenome]
MFDHILNCFRNSVKIGHFIKQAVHRPFSAGSIITNDVNKDGIIQYAKICNSIIKTANFMICMFPKSSISFHLMCKHFFFISGKCAPVFYVGWFWTQFGILRYDSEFLLTFQCFFTNFIPSLIKFPFVFIDIFLWCVMWCVRSTSSKINHERFIRSQSLLKTYPAYRLVGHISSKMVIRIFWNFNLSSSIIN